MGLISNFPSGGKKPVGTALSKDVLLNKTFSNSEDIGMSGGLMVPRGAVAPDTLNQWKLRISAADNGWGSVCYGNGLFVAVAYTGTGNRVMTSPDGITWTIRTSAADNNWRSVCYGNGLFVAVASSGTGNHVMTSPDGITWTIRTSAADNGWGSVCYGNGLFVAVAYSGTGNRVMTSPDGITWTIRTSAADNSWYSVCYGNGLFVAVAGSGIGNHVMTSPAPLQLAQAGIMKTIQSLDVVTATYVSSTVVGFQLKPLVSDISIISIENIIAHLISIQKTTTAYAISLTWTYDNTTGILTCTSSSSLFESGTTKAKIYIMM